MGWGRVVRPAEPASTVLSSRAKRMPSVQLVKRLGRGRAAIRFAGGDIVVELAYLHSVKLCCEQKRRFSP